MEEIKEVHGFQCQYCGEIYPRKEDAELCWQRHTEFEMEPLFQLSEEFPYEILVKKIEGSKYTEIATYELRSKTKVDLPRKKENEQG